MVPVRRRSSCSRAGYTLLRNEHVQASTSISGRFTKRTQIWIDIFGLVFFLLPLVLVIIHLSMAAVHAAPTSASEMSSNAGGLIRWPVFALLPLGFLLLRLQAHLGADQARRVPARA